MKQLFFQPKVWILLAVLAFLLLPAKALHYGLFDSRPDEILKSMGWYGANLSWSWFCSLLLFPLLARIKKSSSRHLATLAACVMLAIWIFLSASLSKWGLGYAVLFLVMALLVIATDSAAKLHFLQADRLLIFSLFSCVLLIGFFILYPTTVLFSSLFYQEGEFAPNQILKMLSRSDVWLGIQNSLSIAVTVAAFSTLFGLMFALYTTRVAKKTAFLGKLFAILPIITPPFVVGLGVVLIFGRSGYVTTFLVEYLNWQENWFYGFTGIVFAQVLALTPMAFMLIEGALKALSPTLEDASYSLRSSPLQTFYYIILPLLKPALANAFLVVAVQSLADFGTPFVLGGNYEVIASQIYFAIVGTNADYPLASLLGTILLLFSLSIFLLQYRWIGKKSYVTVSGKTRQGHFKPLASGLKWVIICNFFLWVGFNLFLYASIFYGSFTVNWGVDHRLTLDNYIELFGQGIENGAFPSLIQTVIFALCAAPITALFGLLLAYLTTRKQFAGRKSLEFLTLLCFTVPGTVAGISYVIAFNHSPIYLTGTAVIIVISMVMRNVPVGMRAAIAGLNQIDKSLDEASLSLRADSWNTFRFIILPLLKPALISALVTSFVRSMTTVSAIIFLVTPTTKVATSYILNRVEDGAYGLAVAYGSVLIIVMLSVIGVFHLLVGKQDKRAD